MKSISAVASACFTKYVIITLLLLGVVACAVAPKSPAQSIYSIENNFRAALVIAVTYKELPKCGTTAVKQLCSDPKVVEKLRTTYDVANASLTAAQLTVRSGQGNAELAITAAQQAVIALTAITSTLEVK